LIPSKLTAAEINSPINYRTTTDSQDEVDFFSLTIATAFIKVSKWDSQFPNSTIS
jgi:hypothetical protein